MSCTSIITTVFLASPMVQAYSRYSEAGTAGLIHIDSAGQTIASSVDGKSIFSAVGTSVIEINAKTGTRVNSVSCSPKVFDEGMNASSLSLKQPCRATTLAVSVDSLAIGCTDGSMKIVSLPLVEDDGGCQLTGHRGHVNAIAFSDVGNLVATGGRDTEIVVWDMLGECGLCRLIGHGGEITSLKFLPGSRDFLISGSKDGLVKVWSMKLQICVQTFSPTTSGEVWSLTFVNNDLFIGSSDRVISVYRCLPTESLVVTSEGLTVLVPFGQLDRPEPSDGRIVTIGSSGEHVFCQTDRRVVEIWRIVDEESEQKKRLKRRQKRNSEIEDVLKASDCYVIASSIESASVALRYVANSRIKAMSVTSTSVVLGLADNQIEMFKIKEGTLQSRSIKREGHRSLISALSLSSDSNKLLSVSGESIIVWNGVSLVYQKQIASPSGEVIDAFWLDNDRVVVVTADGHLCAVDVNTGAIVGEPMRLGDDMEGKKQKKTSAVKCVYHKDKKILIGMNDKRVLVIDILVEEPSFAVVACHSNLPDEPVCLTMGEKTGTYIAAGLLNGNVEVIYTDSGKHYMSLFAHKLPITSVAFSPDEQVVVSGSVDKNIKVWSIKFGNVLKSIRAHDSTITQLKFVPHTHLVWSTARDGVVSLWDIDRFERVLSKVHGGELLALELSPDAGMVFTAGSDRAICRLMRVEDQMFIEEEAEKAMELEVDGEAQRDDFRVNGDSTLPTKSSIESVRLVERVVEMIEIDEDEINDATIVMQKKKDLVKFVAIDTPASQLQQIVVSLPTGHARKLLAVIADVLENIMDTKTNKFPPGFPVEACVSAGLFIIQAQAKYLLGEHHSRAVLLRLKDLFHHAIGNEIENVGIAAAGMRLSTNLE